MYACPPIHTPAHLPGEASLEIRAVIFAIFIQLFSGMSWCWQTTSDYNRLQWTTSDYIKLQWTTSDYIKLQ